MRLLDVNFLRLHEFREDQVPRYAIASHRWQIHEVTFQDFVKERNVDSPGYGKVVAFAEYVKNNIHGVEFLWMDTCCIDKRSSAELSHAINMMFKWFRDAELCLVHLSDVGDQQKETFLESQWFTRAWTLQELLAPRTVVFVNASWNVIGNKGASFHGYSGTFVGPGLERDIATKTGIPEHILHDYSNSDGLSVEEKFQWTEGRLASREEDMSYALYGIFNVALGINYGEGSDAARQRLRAGIAEKLKRQKDLYLFRHAPLDDPTSQIRILTILDDGERDGPVRCSLSHMALDRAPAYVALSYHWGNANSVVPLHVTKFVEAAGGEAKFPVNGKFGSCASRASKKRHLHYLG